MKLWLSSALIFLSLLGGCRKATFQSIDGSKQNDTNSGRGTGDLDAKTPELIVTVPMAEILDGGKTTQPTAAIKGGAENPPVKWTVMAPPGKDAGKIDPNKGTYTSPNKVTEKYPITITATLIADDKVKGSTPLNVKPSADSLALEVTLPVSELKVGGLTTQAKATLSDGTIDPPVKWSVAGSGSTDIGTINPTTGVYTSPATGMDAFGVIITATLVANEAIKGTESLQIIPVNADKAALVVTVPSPEIKVGGNKITAVATLKDGTTKPPVKWSVMTANGKDPGTIDAAGVYTSPAVSVEKYPVIITATLISDEAVKASVPLSILPQDVIFARCKKANTVFPIVADVFELAAATDKLPTDWTKEKYKLTVCMDQYAVLNREFTSGFPDVPKLFEWFGLNTRTTLFVPVKGTYTFRLNSDDGSKMWVDGKLIITNDGLHGEMPRTATIELTAGDHPLVIDYFQGPRYHLALELKWKTPGSTTYVLVPKENFK